MLEQKLLALERNLQSETDYTDYKNFNGKHTHFGGYIRKMESP